MDTWQDILLGVWFLCLFAVGSVRAWQNLVSTAGGKVVTAFYGLISASAALRALWFLIPSSALEPAYAPTPVWAFESTEEEEADDAGVDDIDDSARSRFGHHGHAEVADWFGVFCSEVLLSLGSLMLYGIFILLTSYWANMRNKVFQDTGSGNQAGGVGGGYQQSQQGYLVGGSSGAMDSSLNGGGGGGGGGAYASVSGEGDWGDEAAGGGGGGGGGGSFGGVGRVWASCSCRSSAATSFTVTMAVLAAAQGVNIILFLCGLYNSDAMILYDAIMLSLVSSATMIEISVVSQEFRQMLGTMAIMNQMHLGRQMQRVYWVTVTANVFFIFRVALEVSLTIFILYLWKMEHSFNLVLSNKYWTAYILLKHGAEAIVLTLLLYISMYSGMGGPSQARRKAASWNQEYNDPERDMIR